MELAFAYAVSSPLEFSAGVVSFLDKGCEGIIRQATIIVIPNPIVRPNSLTMRVLAGKMAQAE